MKWGKILVPTDFSEHSDRALAQALDIAKYSKAKLDLLHVVHEEVHRCAADYCIPDNMLQQMQTGMMAAAKEGLDKQLARFPQAKDVEVETNVRKGFPAEEIVKEQQEKGADLIVIAPLGRTGIARYLVGSVTNNVVKEAKCPVLVAK
jgi:universal stress protein A